MNRIFKNWHTYRTKDAPANDTKIIAIRHFYLLLSFASICYHLTLRLTLKEMSDFHDLGVVCSISAPNFLKLYPREVFFCLNLKIQNGGKLFIFSSFDTLNDLRLAPNFEGVCNDASH